MDGLFIHGLEIDMDKLSPESYVRDIPAIGGLNELRFTKPVTFFAGENGSGKSTLLEALAVAAGFNPEGGTKNYSFSTRDSHSELCGALRLIRSWRRPGWGYFLRAESFYNVATQEELYARDGRIPSDGLHERSHGESFLTVAQKHLRPESLYLLDEPEAALSPQRQLTLLLDIYSCAMDGSQFFIVTHSPILLGLPGAEILSFDSGQVRPIAYEETDSFRVTKMFISRREQVLRELLDSFDLSAVPYTDEYLMQ